MADLVVGPDGRSRCGWGVTTPDYLAYHDHEWGRPVTSDRVLLEKLCLEGFQAGLSWLTILRKRAAFREVFADFDAEIVASYDESDVRRLLDDARIIRHKGKIEASITNARAMLGLRAQGGTLAELVWGHRPSSTTPPQTLAALPAVTAESTALARDLKAHGFRFVGPTTAYAAMQAMGVVNDHLDGCWVREACGSARTEVIRGLGDQTQRGQC